MKKTIFTCIAAAVLTLTFVPAGITSSPQKAYACSKGEYTTPEYDYSVASNVFSGAPIKVDNVYLDGKLYRMGTFVTDTIYKGSGVRTLLTPLDSDQCGATFELGHNYLVYANNSLDYPSANVFNIFEGDEAKERIEQLKNLDQVPVPTPGVHIETLYPGHNITLTLDGHTIPVTPAPVFFKNSLYVPMTFFRDVLGYVTIWNSESGRYEIMLKSDWAGIFAKGDSTKSEFTGSASGIPEGTAPFEAGVTYSDVRVKVDGKLYAPEHLPFTYDGVVYVALRSTAEKLGLQVSWLPETYTAQLRDIRPIDEVQHPILVMKLSSNNAGEADLIIDKINNDQALYRIDRPLGFGEKAEQLTAPFTELIKETNSEEYRKIRLFLHTNEREKEMMVTEALRDALLRDPDMRARASLVLSNDHYMWPTSDVFGLANIR
ncbi:MULTISPECIES: stalk domain-containing protein [unclassified Paenibacillus]|uniref:stalk domain-containing protein n=1 Tax=unclassified Paenibacillus TaxID=185978 RepID=UPI00362781A2